MLSAVPFVKQGYGIPYELHTLFNETEQVSAMDTSVAFTSTAETLCSPEKNSVVRINPISFAEYLFRNIDFYDFFTRTYG